MTWWMWLIIIYYCGPQVVLSVMILRDDANDWSDYHFMSPRYIHEEHDNLNWFGVILFWLLCFILFPGVYVAYFLEWLFTVGRRK